MVIVALKGQHAGRLRFSPNRADRPGSKPVLIHPVLTQLTDVYSLTLLRLERDKLTTNNDEFRHELLLVVSDDESWYPNDNNAKTRAGTGAA